MNLRRALPILACVCGTALLSAHPATACGPFFEYPAFTFATHPDFPLDPFAGGKLGILQPGYGTTYLVVAYRYLSGVGLDEASRRTAIDTWKDHFNGASSEGEPPVKQWQRQRLEVAGIAPLPPIQTHRREENWITYSNCLDDAFRNASRTLAQRIDTFGADNPHVAAWVKAQDRVFANCSGGPSIPEPAADDAPPLLRADRAYQIAAAHFYAGDLDEAEPLFRAIAADPSSPWRALSTYIVARVLIRAQRLDAAEAQLQYVLADPSLASLHDAAQRLLGLVRFRLHPEDRALELGSALAAPSLGSTFRQDLSDYSRLIQDPFGDDLSAWIAAFRQSAPNAIETWQKKRTLPWLIAALSVVPIEDPRLDELLAAARAVAHDSPGYLTVAYHRFRLLAAAGRREEARQRLDSLLATGGTTAPPSSRNLLLWLRASMARDLDDFLDYAPQTPVGIIDGEGEERMVPKQRVGWDEAGYARFDVTSDLDNDLPPDFDDSTKAALELLPVRALKRAGQHRGLAPNLRGRILPIAWTRAVLVDDDANARALYPLLLESNPELKPALDAYGRARSREERHFTAVLALLRAPGLSPVFNDRQGLPLTEIDNYRRNWWCGMGVVTPDDTAPLFLGDRDLKAARLESAKLATFAPNFLAGEVLAWGRAHRDDPLVPEALHQAVRSTRYGCIDASTGKLSQAAFRLLHRRYPKSEWTARTPYWFN
jgi:tetratricopeptide (TPR) repeat protein